ncbi:hypothetical protein SARC_12274, partial [Sphaeroforma arctica JP610]
MEKVPWEPSVPALHPDTQQMASFDWLGVVEFTQNESFMDKRTARYASQVGPSMSVLELLKAKGVKLSTLRAVFASEADLPPLVRLIDAHTVHGGAHKVSPEVALSEATKLLQCQTSMEFVLPDTEAVGVDGEALEWDNLFAAERAVFDSNRKYSTYLRKSREAATAADLEDMETEKRVTKEYRGKPDYSSQMRKARQTQSQNISRYIHDLYGDETDEDEDEDEGEFRPRYG